VLCYHAVSETWNDPLAVRPDALERQIRVLLHRRYQPVPLVETLDGRGRLLHVTFDDAYRSVAIALPLLERLHVPVTVFACPSYADDGRPLAIPELAAEARAYPEELTTMTWNDLRGLVDRGVEVGSHTLSHPHLPQLSDSELGRELRDSRQRLQDELGRACRFLAYPYGEHDARVHAAASAAGYEAAFSLSAKRNLLDRYALPRIAIWRRDGLPRVVLKTSPILGQVSRPFSGRQPLSRERSRSR
jgi:peptidoglycan/xylan/chitin deacetylase (PgdA/CDA1 family)